MVQGDAIPQLIIPRLIEMYRAGAFRSTRLVHFYHAVVDAQSGAVYKPVLRIA